MLETKPTLMITHLNDQEWYYLSEESGTEADMRWKIPVNCTGSTGRGTSMGICEIPPDTSVPPHYHAEDEIYYITTGDGEMLLGDDIVPVTAGSVLYVPGDLVHGIRCTGETPVVMTYVFPTARITDVVYHGVERNF